jgi:outer membrane receptor for ferrienterochelin and colicin
VGSGLERDSSHVRPRAGWHAPCSVHGVSGISAGLVSAQAGTCTSSPCALSQREHTLKRTIIAVLVAMGLTTIASVGYAQEPPDLTSLSPEELAALPTRTISNAAKYLQKIVDAPASVSIVTGEEIRLYGYRTLADVLNSVRGFSISYDRNYTYLGFRGLSRPGDLNTRILILIDGHRLNDNVFDSALVGNEFPVDLENVDRVEVVSGPGASMYGTSAFSAVISVITKRGSEEDGVEVAGTLGAFDARRVRTAFGKTYGNGLHLLLSGSAASSLGASRLYFSEFDAPETNSGVADRADGERFDRLSMNLEAGHFSVQSVYAARLKHIPTAAFGTVFNDPRTRTFDGRGYFDVQYGRELGQRSDLIARAYWDHYRYDGWYVLADQGSVTTNRDLARGSWLGGEVNLSRRLSTRQRVMAGAEFRQSLQQDQDNYDEAPSATVYLDDRRRLATWAVNLQDELNLHRRVQLNAAVRYESVSSGGARVTPKLGVITHLRAATTMKVLFSRALRSPSVYERFYASPPNYVSNPSVAPEEIESFEVAVEHALSLRMHISGSLFTNRVDGLIISQANESGLIQFANGLDTQAHGFEVAWSGRSRVGVQARASYSALWDSKEQPGAWFGGASRRTAKFNLAVPIERLHLTTGLSIQVAGTRWTHTGEALPAVAVANLNVVGSLKKNVEIQGGLFNMFNVRYSEPASTDHVEGGIPQAGRQIAVKLVWRLR